MSSKTDILFVIMFVIPVVAIIGFHGFNMVSEKMCNKIEKFTAVDDKAVLATTTGTSIVTTTPLATVTTTPVPIVKPVIDHDTTPITSYRNTQHCHESDDPATRFKFNWPKLLLEDPVMLSSNYNAYDSFVAPENIELKITQYKKRGFQLQGEVLPAPSNYAFRN